MNASILSRILATTAAAWRIADRPCQLRRIAQLPAN